ncbi:MAG: anthranilate phosphoribosyltransferase [Propionibacteriales bacterium]|nr:anthranilate phosphoribosyltransferase [Propionibacteriales bacterium]
MGLPVTVTHAWPEVLSTLVGGNDLTAGQAAWAMQEILDGAASPAQIGGFAVALRAKGESVDEVEALVRTMYSHAIAIDVPGQTLDVVGTGGDRAHTVNISTMSAIVAAGAGARVVKHGNRAASSSCGTADVLERLGVRLDLPPSVVAEVGREAGITFCFAPMFHPALRHAAVPRRELGIATVFNFLGPLANPARPTAQAVGCADLRMAPILAGVLARRGVSALVFRGDDGLDELTSTTTSQVWAVRDGSVSHEVLDPAGLGVPVASPAALKGGDVDVNAAAVHRLLEGETGAVRDTVVLNAGASLAALEGGAGSLEERVGAGMERAVASLDSGAAAAVLERWIETSTRLADS